MLPLSFTTNVVKIKQNKPTTMGLFIYINPEDSREATLLKPHIGALVDSKEGHGTITFPQATGSNLTIK